ncbi:uncharacterized protein An12g08410 [Aspergillus niger]|uniref:Contig An12c0280, genomic contig n=2 Tax=Aspergillus niger TaxID=5061 RepID=A2R0F3_ASPNC|nr:uncharacterized protein An12g08410 [Aspergillus niger]CAK41291.1 unnamed protein product [Aspergillus niger]
MNYYGQSRDQGPLEGSFALLTPPLSLAFRTMKQRTKFSGAGSKESHPRFSHAKSAPEVTSLLVSVPGPFVRVEPPESQSVASYGVHPYPDQGQRIRLIASERLIIVIESLDISSNSSDLASRHTLVASSIVSGRSRFGSSSSVRRQKKKARVCQTVRILQKGFEGTKPQQPRHVIPRILRWKSRAIERNYSKPQVIIVRSPQECTEKKISEKEETGPVCFVEWAHFLWTIPPLQSYYYSPFRKNSLRLEGRCKCIIKPNMCR